MYYNLLYFNKNCRFRQSIVVIISVFFLNDKTYIKVKRLIQKHLNWINWRQGTQTGSNTKTYHRPRQRNTNLNIVFAVNNVLEQNTSGRLELPLYLIFTWRYRSCDLFFRPVLTRFGTRVPSSERSSNGGCHNLLPVRPGTWTKHSKDNHRLSRRCTWGWLAVIETHKTCEAMLWAEKTCPGRPYRLVQG